jgi:hypothetical protein
VNFPSPVHHAELENGSTKQCMILDGVASRADASLADWDMDVDMGFDDGFSGAVVAKFSVCFGDGMVFASIQQVSCFC